MQISTIRISRLEIDFQVDALNATNNRIDVLVTVLDKNSYYGTVENLQPEATLDEAVSRLNDTIRNNKLVVNFRADNTTVIQNKNNPISLKQKKLNLIIFFLPKFFDFVAIPDSLRQIERNRNNNNVYFNKNIETLTKTGFTAGKLNVNVLRQVDPVPSLKYFKKEK
jgi:hypothetical protein